MWEPITIAGRNDTGKLKPYLNQDLCLEYVGTNGTYSHFGVTNSRWWYFLLEECEDGNDLQILEGHDNDNPFEIIARDETLTDERVLSQAHDPRAGEIILGEKRREFINEVLDLRVCCYSGMLTIFIHPYIDVAEFDFTSLWDKYRVEYLPENPVSSGSSLFCPPWPLMKTDEEEWEIVRSNNTIVNWEADTFVEQYNNGRFVVRRGFPDRKETILFDNELDLPEDDYFTKLRGNGDLITFRGTPEDPKGDSVWKISNDRSESQFFLGVECDLGTVSLYEFVPEDPGEKLWTTEGTDWVPDLTTMPPTPAPTLPVSTTTEPEDTTQETSATVESVGSTVEPDTTVVEASTTTLVVPVSTTVVPVTETDEPETTTATTEPETTSTTETPSPTPSNNIAPGVVAVSGSFCTPSAPCPMCYGDCDVSYMFGSNIICVTRLIILISFYSHAYCICIFRKILTAKEILSVRKEIQAIQ